MPTTDINLAAMKGRAVLSADGTATTNSISGTFSFTNVALQRQHDGKMTFSADFKSDGAVSLNGFSAGTAARDIVGLGGSVAITQGTTTSTLFDVNFDSWSARVQMREVEYGTFASRWRASKPTTGNVVGSVTGVVRDRDLLPR